MNLKLPQALPSLDGAHGRIVRIVYVLLALVTIAVVAGSLLFNGLDFFRNMPNAAGYGFKTATFAQNRIGIDVVWPSARARGLRERDTVVAIDGRALGDRATEYDVGAALGRAGGRVALVVERGGVRHTLMLDRQPSRWTPVEPGVRLPLWLYSGFSFSAGLIFPLFLIAASLMLFLRRPRDSEAVLMAFGFLLLCARSDVTWWMAPFLGIGDMVRAIVSHYGWLACGVAIAVFPDGRFVNRWARISVAMTLFAALVVSPLHFWYGRQSTVFSEVFYNGLMLLALVPVVLRWRRTSDQIARQQIKWTVTGFAITALTILILSPPGLAAIAALGQPWTFLTVRLLVLIGYLTLPLGLLVSLLRYRLYDAETAISRSIAYGVLTLSLLAIFAGSERIIESLGEDYFGGSVGALAGGLGAAVAAVLIAPLHHRVTRWAERRFHRNLLQLRQGLPLLVGDLRETARLEELADAVLQRVRKGVRAVAGVLIVDDRPVRSFGIEPGALGAWLVGWRPAEGEALDCDPADPLLPMRVPLAADGWGRVGWLLLGPRPDASFYNKDERETLAGVADPVARAVAIVRDREARVAELEAERIELRLRIQGMEGRFGLLEAALETLGGRRKSSPSGA